MQNANRFTPALNASGEYEPVLYLAPCRSIPVTAEMRKKDQEKQKQPPYVSAWSLGEELRKSGIVVVPKPKKPLELYVPQVRTKKPAKARGTRSMATTVWVNCKWCDRRMGRKARDAHQPHCTQKPLRGTPQVGQAVRPNAT